MKVAVLCEFSGIVRDAFINAGHEAISCDLLPTERSGPHYQGDMYDILYDEWDMIIAFTPCTYSCNSGIRWMYNPDKTINIERWNKMLYYAGMLRDVLNSDCDKVVCENPIPHRFAVEVIGRKYDQIIQPWQFGHGETKATCLWLKGVDKLRPTNIVEEREQRIWKMPPSKDRSKLRSTTFPGIADAMANQWAKRKA